MAEDDTTRDLPEPKPADTQPNLLQLLNEVHQTRELLMAEISATRHVVEKTEAELAEFRQETKERLDKLDNSFKAFNKRLTSAEAEIVGLDSRVETLEERP